MANDYSPVKAALWRFARVAGAVILAGLAQYYGKSDWYLIIAPALVALDKFVRDTK